jgi:glutamate racemase
MSSGQKIGIFDSGVGGLSVLRSVIGVLPHHSIIYVADQAHVPYGRRPLEEVQAFSFEITRWLLKQGCSEIIVACNTASAVALHELRKAFPEIPFVGMEPAVKPAAEQTHSGVVGVIATPATFQGALYASVVERFASEVTVLEDTCPGLVEEIEAGHLDGPQTRQILEKALKPMLAKGIDTVVLGCTHFPFVIPLIEQITGPNVRVIDPAPAVARQAARLFPEEAHHPTTDKTIRMYTSGDPVGLKNLLTSFLTVQTSIHAIHWDADNRLSSPGN